MIAARHAIGAAAVRSRLKNATAAAVHCASLDTPASAQAPSGAAAAAGIPSSDAPERTLDPPVESYAPPPPPLASASGLGRFRAGGRGFPGDDPGGGALRTETTAVHASVVACAGSATPPSAVSVGQLAVRSRAPPLPAVSPSLPSPPPAPCTRHAPSSLKFVLVPPPRSLRAVSSYARAASPSKL